MFDFLKKKSELWKADFRSIGSVYSYAKSGDMIILEDHTGLSEPQMEKAVKEACYKYQKVVQKSDPIPLEDGGWQVKLLKY